MNEAKSGSNDEAVIREIVESRDKQVAHSAPGIDWENAFGVRRVGLDEVREFLNEHLAPTLAKAHRTTLETRVRFITAEVAVADEYWHLKGQTRGAGGPEAPERRGRTTHVLLKNQGKWTIILQRIADLRTSL